MFREMRRFKQQLPETEMIQILENGKTAVLGVSGDDGYPYTVPINYVYADGKIYFHQAKSGHKYDSMKRCGKVSLCVIEKDDVVAEEFTAYYRSVIVFGRARILETDEEIFHAAQVLSLKYYNDKDAVEKEIQKAWKALSCVEITIEHMTGKEAIELTRMRTEESQS
ncbi:MAG: pyridoxamine 5'-phosphate oxidase family protein [Hungatella hathewayi]|nr:pyridoxamine 5'-phosphate oxidase family protein [Hungatella hathewayi]